MNSTNIKDGGIEAGIEAFLIHRENRRLKQIQKETAEGKWPKVGEKVRFIGADGIYYPHYTNVIKNAKDNLVVDQEYTVRKCEVYSSWCAVWLEELLGEENLFHLPMFERFPQK